jgi:hypothetical protein
MTSPEVFAITLTLFSDVADAFKVILGAKKAAELSAMITEVSPFLSLILGVESSTN